MFSRDVEVHALAIETNRLSAEAERLLLSLRDHESTLKEFILEARDQLVGADESPQATTEEGAI